MQTQEKSNNQRVKEGKISPRWRMRNVQVPISCLLDATDNRARQRHPKGWYDARKNRCCIEVKLLNRERRRQLHLLHIHAVLMQLLAVAVHDGSTHTQVNHHEREHQSHQYVE